MGRYRPLDASLDDWPRQLERRRHQRSASVRAISLQELTQQAPPLIVARTPLDAIMRCGALLAAAFADGEAMVLAQRGYPDRRAVRRAMNALGGVADALTVSTSPLDDTLRFTTALGARTIVVTAGALPATSLATTLRQHHAARSPLQLWCGGATSLQPAVHGGDSRMRTFDTRKWSRSKQEALRHLRASSARVDTQNTALPERYNRLRTGRSVHWARRIDDLIV